MPLVGEAMIVGIDIGTQSLQAVVTDARLKVTGEGAIQYRPSYPGPDRVEQNPAIWERALAPAIAAALKQAEVPAGRVAALGICGQLDGCVAVDGSGAPLGPCLIWMDRRAQAEAAEVPSELIRARSGVVRDPSHMGAKIAWLRRHDSRAAGAARFHQPVSYLVERLTGAAVMDHALASTSMLYSLERRSFDPELLDRFGIDVFLSFEDRVATVASLCERGHADQMVLSHDAACFNDWLDEHAVAEMMPRWNYLHISQDVLPALRARGVTGGVSMSWICTSSNIAIPGTGRAVVKG